jgi:hypothetical protein
MRRACAVAQVARTGSSARIALLLTRECPRGLGLAPRVIALIVRTALFRSAWCCCRDAPRAAAQAAVQYYAQSSQWPRTEGRGQRMIGNPAQRSECEGSRSEKREKESCLLGSVRSGRFPKRTQPASEGGRLRARRLGFSAIARRPQCAEANENGGRSERRSGQRT